ncbi:MAG: NHLP bacteriocin export ABC transporter permease/ATPase subunit [Acidaminococcaceae bacterium]|nr:NHLP bacteriocin export ABC transporter permease/ATPase subunit [Acidaminococcaceae bacterium]
MKLVAGERFRLPEEDKYIKVISGKLEAYAVTRRQTSYRQIFLMELGPGEAAFPSMDEFEQIDVQIYAVEDSELEECAFDGADPAQLAPLMRNWFTELIRLPWLRLMADRGDEVLKKWADGSVLAGQEKDLDRLLEEFADNEGIFAMLLGVRYSAQDKHLARRIEQQTKHKRRLLDETISKLLGEQVAPEEEMGTGNAMLEDAVFIVRYVAQALKMPYGEINMAPEMVRKLDQLGLLRRLVEKGGMQMRQIRLDKDWYTGDCGVLLGYYEEKQELAALLPETPVSYRIVTREHPEGMPVTEETAGKINGDAFLCYPGLPAQKLTRNDFLRFLFRQCWKKDWTTILAVSVVAGLIPLITPVVTGTMFQDIIPILDRKGLATVVQVAVVAGFTAAALDAVRSVALVRVSSAVDMNVRPALVSRLLSLPARFFRTYQSGDLASRMMGAEMIIQFLSNETLGVFFNFIFSFWSLLLMCYYSLKLTAVALVVWVVYILICSMIMSRLVSAQREMTTAKNKTQGILQQIFTGLVKFRVRGAEEQAYHLWGELFAKEWKWNYHARWLKNYNTILSAIQPVLLSLLLYYFGIRELADGAASNAGNVLAEALGDGGSTLTTATFIAFQAAYTSFNSSLNAVIPSLEMVSVVRPLLENIQPILDAEPESSEEKPDAEVLSGALEVRNLRFAYEAGQREVLKDISFRIAAGEHVAIVGKSGCGKSTLIRLLLGFEKPLGGAVYYDGQNLADLNAASVRSQLGVVLQNGQLLTGDIYHNIVGVNDLTMDDAWAAAEAAGIAEDIREMPMQMQTMVSEGSTNISGGQRQRILIARALAVKPAIIICDEATSALDNRTQAIVTKSLDRLHATRIVVAHRLSTIRNADRIIVLDGGRVAESGTFDELVKKGGIFAAMVQRQVA